MIIPMATRAIAAKIKTLSTSPGINKADSKAPETGTINLYMLNSPALLYFRMEYHRAKAAAERNAE